jgi:hypothetical protein
MSNSFNLDLFRKTYQGPTIRVKLAAAENAASYLPAIPFTSSKDVGEYFSTLEEEPREVVIATYLACISHEEKNPAVENVGRRPTPPPMALFIAQGSCGGGRSRSLIPLVMNGARQPWITGATIPAW